MDFHDYHLRGYSVSDFGSTVTLDLLYDYEGRPRRQSTIAFTGVTLYHFTHTGGAIITDITEVPVVEQITEVAEDLACWHKWYGLVGWGDGIETYKAYVANQGFRAWTIDSAIGFAGFVVAKHIA
jgi:hypothetical protein